MQLLAFHSNVELVLLYLQKHVSIYFVCFIHFPLWRLPHEVGVQDLHPADELHPLFIVFVHKRTPINKMLQQLMNYFGAHRSS